MTATERPSVLLVGCGRMGGALARGWTEAWEVRGFDPHLAVWPSGIERIRTIAEGGTPDVIVLAVKPQNLIALLPDVALITGATTTIVSVAAGVRLAALRNALGGTGELIRAMPNTPAAVCKGMTALVAQEAVSSRARARAEALFTTVGQVAWVPAEHMLDAVTAVSGSGPAYFFRMAEALAHAGREAGLPDEIAKRLARATLIGAGGLAAERGDPLDVLRREVTSPGGTTAAGLAALDGADAIDALMGQAVARAAARSRELAE